MNPIPFWDQYGLTAIVRAVLSSAPVDQHPTASTGRMFLTTYQIVIEIERQRPDVVAAFITTFPPSGVGGSGTGPYAFTTYLAQNLSRLIRYGILPDIEMRFLAGQNLTNLSFDNEGEEMGVSTLARVTMFRLTTAEQLQRGPA